MIKPVTAVLPSVGPVTWEHSDLDKQARAWAKDHRPESSSLWPLRVVVRWNDTRRCAACPKTMWQACPYALWARYWEAQQLQAGRAVNRVPAAKAVLVTS